jgi:hypothetical protein
MCLVVLGSVPQVYGDAADAPLMLEGLEGQVAINVDLAAEVTGSVDEPTDDIITRTLLDFAGLLRESGHFVDEPVIRLWALRGDSQRFWLTSFSSSGLRSLKRLKTYVRHKREQTLNRRCSPFRTQPSLITRLLAQAPAEQFTDLAVSYHALTRELLDPLQPHQRIDRKFFASRCAGEDWQVPVQYLILFDPTPTRGPDAFSYVMLIDGVMEP